MARGHSFGLFSVVVSRVGGWVGRFEDGGFI
jgi:hypothetical protein